MSANADEMERLGRQSGNPTFEDIAVLAAQYQRAYVTALPTYTSADNFLLQSATFLVQGDRLGMQGSGIMASTQ